jgi:hypothetical protein
VPLGVFSSWLVADSCWERSATTGIVILEGCLAAVCGSHARRLQFASDSVAIFIFVFQCFIWSRSLFLRNSNKLAAVLRAWKVVRFESVAKKRKTGGCIIDDVPGSGRRSWWTRKTQYCRFSMSLLGLKQ